MAKAKLTLEQYEENAHKTIANSTSDHLDKVLSPELISVLRRFVDLARTIDTYKKSAFYGRNIESFPEQGPVGKIKVAEYRERVPFQLIHGVLGIAGESGEIVEILLNLLEGVAPPEGKTWQDLLNEELGDELWYLTVASRANGSSLEAVGQGNNKKLFDRWGEDTKKQDFKEE